jgi:aminoglycoside/choline kinase family phosphotransferase
LSSDREALKAKFLADNGFGAAVREPLAGDASTRAYERLRQPDGRRMIFMDQPPGEGAPCPPEATPAEREAAGYNALARLAAGRVDAFVAVAGWLKDQGLSAPGVLAQDAARGLAVLEDLGDGIYARLIEQGTEEGPLYDAAIEALARLHAVTPPKVLEAQGCSWPLLDYDAVALKVASDLFVDWLPKLRPQVRVDAGAIAEWNALWAPIQARGAAGAAVFCHRDYHAENLIWLPDRQGARRDVSPALEDWCLDRYFTLRPQVDRAQFLADFHALGALNIVRIIGVFARLVTRDDKPRYLEFLPRMWAYLDRCLADPTLEPMRAWLDANVPMDARS